jgi:hypothetical protein
LLINQKMKFRQSFLLTVVGFCSLAPFSNNGFSADAYEILEIFSGSNTLVPTDLNNQSEVVGYSIVGVWPNDTYQPFYWSAATGIVFLDRQGRRAQANAINEMGTIVGFDLSGGCFWTRAGRQTLMHSDIASATDINDLGQIAGAGRVANGNVQPVIGDGISVPNFLPFEPKSQYSVVSINNANQVIVSQPYSDSTNGNARLWSAATGVQVLVSLTPGQQSWATRINDSGVIGGTSIRTEVVVVGTTTAIANTRYATRWTAVSAPADSGKAYWVEDINNHGEMIGFSFAQGTGADEPLFFESNGARRSLAQLLPNNTSWTITRPSAINDRGEIISPGHKNGIRGMVLLRPISLFQKWLIQSGLPSASEALSDPNRDGWSLALEYGLGRSQSVQKTSDQLPQAGRFSLGEPATPCLGIAVDLPSVAPADVEYTVEWSAELKTWTALAKKNGSTPWVVVSPNTLHLQSVTQSNREIARIGLPEADIAGRSAFFRLIVSLRPLTPR